MGAFGDFIRSATTVLPEVPKPTRKPTLTEKLIWTAIALALYLTMSQIPLYGVQAGRGTQVEFINIIFASSQGTLMTLGIGPIVTAGLILQLLKGSEIIRLDFKKPEDRALFTSATKFLTMIVIVLEGAAYIFGGVFNPSPEQALPFLTAMVILIQLFTASVIVMLLDELVQKGWGIGSGISLFILAGVAQRIMWDVFSPLPVGGGYLGIFPFLINATLTGHPQTAILRSQGLPSLFTLGLTLLVVLIIVYVEGMRIEIPITSTKYRGFAGTYPIKLLYVSNIPIILTSALIANITFFSQLLWSRFNPLNNDPYLSWIATYNASAPGSPSGGIVYYMTTPQSIEGVFADPVRAVTYVLFTVLFAVLFARIWVEIGGLSPQAVAKSLIDADVQVPGFRRAGLSVEAILSRYIPTITIIGGAFIGLLASSSDLLGVFGSGVGILLMIDIILQYYQLLMREQLETMMPRLGALLGKG